MYWYYNTHPTHSEDCGSVSYANTKHALTLTKNGLTLSLINYYRGM